MNKYRNLTTEEIELLRGSNMCIAEDWSKVFVKDGFNPNRLYQVCFSGEVYLGKFEKSFDLPGGISKKSGVRYATLHNVVVGDDSCVENVDNYIANYVIGSDCYIKNVGIMYVDGVTSFGEGTAVSVLNEMGGREIRIHSKLSSHMAYMTALYRHRTGFQEKMNALADFYTTKHSSNIGTVADHCQIMNVSAIHNVRFGEHTRVIGASYLKNGTVNSNAEDPVLIGSNVTCRDFIISSGATLDNGAAVERCFIGQACELNWGYSANDSLFFCNSFGANGEACAIFAGPYTVTHHKCSLLIAGMYSFLNAGSGSNQSNHMYKLGPLHNGIMERGVKTSSDSYVLYPARIGAFSLIMGRHVGHPDTTDLPFSYLIEKDNDTSLVPGVNLRSVGTIRDAQKWPKRDKRKDSVKLDHINFNLLSPYTIQKMFAGKSILHELQDISGEGCNMYTYHNVNIKNSSLKNGLKYYNMGITKFLGNAIVKRLENFYYANDAQLQKALLPTTEKGLGDWVDVSGLIAPRTEISRLLDDIENGTLGRLQDINDRLQEIAASYYEWEWTWDYYKIGEYFGIDMATITRAQVRSIVRKWQKAVVDLDNLVYTDAQKEFSLSAMTGFGADGDSQQAAADFASVRGEFETNSFVKAVLTHIETKTALGEDLLKRL